MDAWRLMVDEPAPGAWNMAVDEALLEAVERGEALPTLRLYRWRPAAVSLGYFQEWERAVDEAACRELGVDVVRRLTGGRAVFHDVEVTYSVTLPPGHLLAGETVMDGYRRISDALREGLRGLGVDADLARPEPTPAGQGRDALAGACFDSASRYEIEWRGRKLVGSAQLRRASGGVLQHGSIPLRFDPERTARALAPGGKGRRLLAEILASRAGSLEQALGREVPFEEVAQALTAGFARALGIAWERHPLSPFERARAEALARIRYGDDRWNRVRPSGRPGSLGQVSSSGGAR